MLCNGKKQKSPEIRSDLDLAPSRFTLLHNIRYGILFSTICAYTLVDYSVYYSRRASLFHTEDSLSLSICHGETAMLSHLLPTCQCLLLLMAGLRSTFALSSLDEYIPERIIFIHRHIYSLKSASSSAQ